MLNNKQSFSIIPPCSIRSEKLIGPQNIHIFYSRDPSVETLKFLKEYIEMRISWMKQK